MVREEEGVEKEGDGVGKEKSAGGSRGKSAFCFSEKQKGLSMADRVKGHMVRGGSDTKSNQAPREASGAGAHL